MKTAFSRLVISLLSLLTVVVALATSALKLLVTAAGVLTSWLERAASKTVRREVHDQAFFAKQGESIRANLRVVTAAPSKRSALLLGLCNLGFKPALANKFVDSLTDDDMRQDIRDLIKAGLKNLGRAA
jgi:Holliday junction resolvasome RuvABC DNA-binding subunit